MHKVETIKSNKFFYVIQYLLKDGLSIRITVTGMSMYPFLREYIDSIELSPANFQNISYGDIILIKRTTGEYVLHRILKKEEDCFYMVGDAQQWVEGPLYPEQLIAVVTAVWRKDKKIECSNFWWKFLSKTWLRLLPLRHLFIRLYRLLKKITRIHTKVYKERQS
jgi:signal peptidase I